MAQNYNQGQQPRTGGLSIAGKPCCFRTDDTDMNQLILSVNTTLNNSIGYRPALTAGKRPTSAEPGTAKPSRWASRSGYQLPGLTPASAPSPRHPERVIASCASAKATSGGCWTT